MVADAQSRIQVVVPVKDLTTAKSRLSPVLAQAERAKLVLTMLRSVLACLTRVDGLAAPLVVTCDREVERVARVCGADLLVEAESSGLNAAMSLAARRIEETGFGSLCYLPADIPLVRPSEIAQLLTLKRPAGRGVTLVPSSDGTGTNALLITPPSAMPFRFGPDSFIAHMEEAGARNLTCHVLELEGIGRDIDRPEDLEILPDDQWRLVPEVVL